MRIIKTRDYQESLKHILLHIAKDKKSTAITFNKDINKKTRQAT